MDIFMFVFCRGLKPMEVSWDLEDPLRENQVVLEKQAPLNVSYRNPDERKRSFKLQGSAASTACAARMAESCL